MLLQMALFHCFLWLSNIPIYIYHSFFVHSSPHRQLGCSHVLSTVNSTAVNLGIQVSFIIRVFFFPFPNIYPTVGMVDHMVTLLLVFHGTAITFFIVTVSICIPTESARVFPFFHTPSFIVCRFGDDDHSGWCEVIPDCTFHLRFSDN